MLFFDLIVHHELYLLTKIETTEIHITNSNTTNLLDRQHGQGTHCTKMSADSLAKMPQNLSAQFVCPIPKVLDLNEIRLRVRSKTAGGLFQN